MSATNQIELIKEYGTLARSAKCKATVKSYVKQALFLLRMREGIQSEEHETIVARYIWLQYRNK